MFFEILELDREILMSCHVGFIIIQYQSYPIHYLFYPYDEVINSVIQRIDLHQSYHVHCLTSIKWIIQNVSSL